MSPHRPGALPRLLLPAALLAALLAALVPPAQAAGEAEGGLQRLERGRLLYEEARFDEAQEALRQALGRVDLSPRQRAQTWFYLGLAYLGLGHETMTAQAFVAAHAADPGFRPPAADLPERARRIWELSAPEQAQAPEPQARPAPRAAPTPAPETSPGIRETRLPEPAPAFSETALSERGPRLSGLQPALGVRGGLPVGAATVFAPSVRTIHLWFAMTNVPAGSRIKAVWSYLNPEPRTIVTTEMEVTRPGSHGSFSCELGTGLDWPQGDYMVELFLDGLPAGRAGFEVR